MMKTTKTPYYDKWSGKVFYYWQDCYFDVYSANNRFGYRIKINRL
jgi:hypothetical protein